MNEMMFGSGSPVWTGMPSVGLTFQPLGIGNPADRHADVQHAADV